MLIIRGLQIVLLIVAFNLGFAAFHTVLQNPFPEALYEVWRYDWFKVTVFDLYVGLFLFSLWVFLRESFSTAFIWTIGFLILGNFLTLIYIILSLNTLKSKNDLKSWFLGKMA